jgi:hypothetical protein
MSPGVFAEENLGRVLEGLLAPLQNQSAVSEVRGQIPNIPSPSYFESVPSDGYVAVFLLTPSGRRIDITWGNYDRQDVNVSTITVSRVLRKMLVSRGARDVTLPVRDKSLSMPGCRITLNAGAKENASGGRFLFSLFSCGDGVYSFPTPNTEAEYLRVVEFIVQQVQRATLEALPKW